MDWKSIIPDKVKATIASWGLTRKLLIQVYTHLHTTLPENPGALTERIPPLQAFAYRFILEDHERLPHRHLFFFAVDKDDASRQLHIVGGFHSTEAAEEN